MKPNQFLCREYSNPAERLKVSVLTTVYNGERFLAETIQSVLNQTLEDFEYIIVNDGSTDGTEEIIKSFDDKRIVYVKNKKNKGVEYLFEPINRGLRIAKGKYIARLDADDLCYRDRLQFQYNYLEKNKDIFLLGGSADIIGQTGFKIDEIIKKERSPFILKLRMAFSNPLIHSSIMFRNERIIYPSRHEHLFYFFLIMYGHKKLKNTSKKLVKYRVHPYGIMSKDADLSKNKYKRFFEEARE